MFNLFNKSSKSNTASTRTTTAPAYYTAKNFDAQVAAAKAAAPKQNVSGRQVTTAYYPGQVSQLKNRTAPSRKVEVAYHK